MSIIRIPTPLQFQWDEGNGDKNWFKHQVSRSEAEEVFFDAAKRLLKEVIMGPPAYEKRYILLGKTKNGRLLFIAFTLRDDCVRVISARDAHQKERPLYEK
jgi:uncharacterized protein